MPGFFSTHFDDRYWVMFPMAKSICFPHFQGENSKFKEQKKITICATAKCIFCIPNFEMCLLVNQYLIFLFVLFDNIVKCKFFPILY